MQAGNASAPQACRTLPRVRRRLKAARGAAGGGHRDPELTAGARARSV